MVLTTHLAFSFIINFFRNVFFYVYSYKLNVVIEDTTGRSKIFLFGGVAEQVVRRTAAELVEESSSNQILLPGALRALVGRSYVFQVVISDQTFRTGQLCFQARRVFMPPKLQGDSATVTIKDNPKEKPAATGPSSTNPDKESSDGSPHIAESLVDPIEENTPPRDTQMSTPAKNSSTKRKEVSTGSQEEHGYAILHPPTVMLYHV